MNKPQAKQSSQALFAPYLRGELGQYRNVGTLTGIALAIVFIGMPIGFIAALNIGIDAENVFVGLWIATLAYALWLESKIRPKAKIGVPHICALLLFLIGIPGIIISNPANLFQVFLLTAYIFVLVVRMAIMFIFIPRCLMESRVSPVLIIIRVLIVSCTIVCLVSNVYFASKGFTIFNSSRPALETWLHPNNLALIASIGTLMTAIDPKFKILTKVGIIAIAGYSMLLTQGRSAILSTIIVLSILFIVELVHDPKKYAPKAVLWGTVILIVAASSYPVMVAIPAFENIIERTTSSDPLAGRGDYVQAALVAWQDSKIFGYGFKSGTLDNFYALMLLQTGIVGLLVYIAFFGVCAYRGLVLFKSRNTQVKLLGKIIIILSISFAIRSFVESASILQLTDLLANAFCLTAGLGFLISPKSDKWRDQ